MDVTEEQREPRLFKGDMQQTGLTGFAPVYT